MNNPKNRLAEISFEKQGYLLRNLPSHLAVAKQYKRLMELAESDFFQVKCDFFKSRSVILADYSLMERVCANSGDWSSLLKRLLEDVRWNEIAMGGISIKRIAAIAAQGHWSETLDMVSFITEDDQRALVLAMLASVSALAGDEGRREELLHQVDEIVERNKSIDYVKLATCIYLADYRRAFRYLITSPAIDEEHKRYLLLSGDHDAGRAFTQILVLLHEYDPEICKEALFYLFGLFSEGDEFFDGFGHPDYDLPVWFKCFYYYVLPYHISRRDFGLFRVLSRKPILFFCDTFFDALNKGLEELSQEDYIAFLNTLFGYIGETVVNSAWVEYVLPVIERLYHSHEQINSIIEQLEHESLQDTVIYHAIGLSRFTLSEKEELLSMLGDRKLKSQALANLHRSHPEMDSAMRERMASETESLVPVAYTKADFFAMLDMAYQWYSISSMPDSEVLEAVWDLGQTNPDRSLSSLEFLFDKDMDLALSKCEELALSRNLINMLAGYLNDNVQNLETRHKTRIRQLALDWFDGLDEDAEDYESIFDSLFGLLCYVDMETAWEKLHSGEHGNYRSLLISLGESAAKQSDEKAVDRVLQKALERDELFHDTSCTAEVTRYLEKYIPDRVLGFISNLDSELKRGDCLISIAQRNMRESKVDRAWQLVSMVKQSSPIYWSLETAYYYEDRGKAPYLDIPYLQSYQVEEAVREIHNSKMPDSIKTILTDHFLCRMYKPEVAWKLAKQYMPDHPFAYTNRVFLPNYFHRLVTEQGWEKAYSHIEEERLPFSIEDDFKDFLFWYLLENGKLSAAAFPLLLDYEELQSSSRLDAIAYVTAGMLGQHTELDSSMILGLLDQETLSDFWIPMGRSVLLRNQPVSDMDMEILTRVSTLLSEEKYEELFSSVISNRPIGSSLAKDLIEASLAGDLPISQRENLIHACWEAQPQLTLELIRQAVEEAPLDPYVKLGFLSETSHIEEGKKAFHLYFSALERDYNQILSFYRPSITLMEFYYAARNVLGEDELDDFINILERFCGETPVGEEKDMMLDMAAAMMFPIDLDKGYGLMEEIEDVSKCYRSPEALARVDKTKLMDFLKGRIVIDDRYVHNNLQVFKSAINAADLSVEELMKLYDEICIMSIAETEQIFLGLKVVRKLAYSDLGRAIDFVKQGRHELYSAIMAPLVKASRIDELVSIFEEYLKKRKRAGRSDALSQGGFDEFYLQLIERLSDKQIRLIPGFLDRFAHPLKRMKACMEYLERTNPAVRADEFRGIFELSIHLAQMREPGKSDNDFPAIMRIGLEKMPLGYITLKMIETKNLGSLSPGVLSLWICKAFHDVGFKGLLELLKAETEDIHRRIP